MSLSVLMYHHVLPTITEHSVTPENFESQLLSLLDSDYTIVSLDQVVNGGLTDNKKYLLITFDDGWLDNWIYAFPLLRKYQIPFSIFIVTDWIGEGEIRHVGNTVHLESLLHDECVINTEKKPDHKDKMVLRWSELNEMEASGLCSIHSHSNSHGLDWTFSDNSVDDFWKDIVKSREILTTKTKSRANVFCWPRGVYLPEFASKAKEAGMSTQFNTIRGINYQSNISNRVLKRINVTNIEGSQLIHLLNSTNTVFFRYGIGILYTIKTRLRICKTAGFNHLLKTGWNAIR